MEASGNLQTSNGRISMSDVKGHFEGTTTDGDINITNIEGTAGLEAFNGGVWVENGKGEFDLESSGQSEFWLQSTDFILSKPL